MKKVLIVSEEKDFFLSSLISQLEKQDYVVIHTSSNQNEIEKIEDELQVILLYTEEVSLKKKGLTYLKGKAVGDRIPILAAGDLNTMKEVEEVIPKRMIRKQFLRPINLKDVLNAIELSYKKEEYVAQKKILVVDDSGAMLRNVKGWLENKYEVILANSGAMAIKYLALNRPDLVLLDYEMPICDGKQVLEMIRAESDFSDMPVMFLTGKNDRESVMSVSDLKPVGYLLKTLEPEKIVRTIDDFFEKQRWAK